MQTDAALLAAVRRAPDDDTPRLVYADWLDDHGDPARAEFIRVQCALARWQPYLDNPLSLAAQHARPTPDPAYAPVWRRNGELLQASALRWSHPFPSLDKHAIDPNGPSSWSAVPCFRRGFVESVFVLPRLLPEAIAAIRSSPEPIRHLWVRAVSDPGDRTVPPRVRSQARDAGIRLLAAAEGLDGIESLHLRFGDVGPAGVEALAAAAGFPRLEALDLYMNRLGDDGARVLARSPLLRRLRVLDLGCNGIGADGLSALGEASAAGRLEVLCLSGNRGAGEWVIRGPDGEWPALRRLKFHRRWGHVVRTSSGRALRNLRRHRSPDPT